MLVDIQKNIEVPVSGTSSLAGAQPAAPNVLNQIPIQHFNPLPDQITLEPATEIFPNHLPNSSQTSHPPTLPLTQNTSNRPSEDDPLSKEIRLYLRALKAKEKAWGPEHITTLDTVNGIGKLYAEQGKFVEAEEMYVRALSGFEKALGTSHDTTLKVSVDLQELHALVVAEGRKI